MLRAKLACCAALVVSCAVGPDYTRPQVGAPEVFRGAPTQADTEQAGSEEALSLADAPWWNVYDDPVLQRLIKEALNKNFDLQIAAARVEFARAQARIVGAELLPELSVVGGLRYGQNTPQAALTTGSSALPWIGAAGFTLNWELDVWGRIRRLREAALAGYQASVEERRGVWITLLGDIAESYFTLRALDAQLELSNKTIESRSATLDLFVERMKGGVGSDVEVARAEANVAQVQAAVAGLKNLITVAENRLSFLLGRVPGPIARASASEAPKVPDVPGLPTQLLERRPDLRAAEDRLMAANASVGAAKGELYPRLSLSALLGLLTIDFDGLNALYGGEAGVSLLTPILQGSKLRAGVSAAEAQYQEAKASYLQAAFNAFREVSDTLDKRQSIVSQKSFQKARVNSLQRAVSLADARYMGGVASYYELLDAQEKLFAAQTELVRVQLDELVASVQLYRALGGGWNLTAVEQTLGDPQR